MKRIPTKAQQEALFKLWYRTSSTTGCSYLAFRRTAVWAFKDCLMVQWCNMTIGIEPDGYTHS